MTREIRVKRVYDPADPSDGTRVLVDGLWPRGIRREEWPEGTWRPDLAPSRELREWYRHDPDRFEEFQPRYRAELDDNPGVEELAAGEGRLTLVTSTKDVAHSHAAVLAAYLSALTP